jgi:hypothetical protein
VIDHTDIQLAARNYAKTLVVVTTGPITLSATVQGYARTTGSFYDDGLWPGMEVAPSGFPQTTPGVITGVTPLALTIKGGRTVAAAAPGRSLVVGLPSRKAWENISLVPQQGEPYVFERYTAGSTTQVTLGPTGDLQDLPMYELLIGLPAETGITVARYTDALRRLFTPRTVISIPSGGSIRVRADQGPQIGQMQQTDTGFAVKPFTVWFRVRSPNVI